MLRWLKLITRLLPVEWPILAGLLGVLAALWGFVELADEVVEGETHEIDQRLLLGLRNPADPSDPLGPGWVEEMMRDFSGLGSTAVLTLVTAAAGIYLMLARKRRVAVLVFLAVGSGQLLSSVLKLAFDRPRPDLVPHATEVFTASFPSGHSTMSAVVYLTLGALLARIEIRRRIRVYIIAVAFVLTLLVGFSRVYLGVHWPSDVLGGWTVGAAWALLWWLVALWLQRRGEVEPEGTQ